MTEIQLVARLFRLGWRLFATVEEAVANAGPTFQILKAMYAAFHGLSGDGILEHMETPRFCSHPDVMPVRGEVCRWQGAEITWSVAAAPAGVDAVGAYSAAFARWAAVCGIRPRYVPGDPSVNILCSIRKIDGPQGVLAESELPCGQARQCRQWYDADEQWGVFDGPGSGIDLRRVATHEIGHALGLSHIGAGNLLAPTYSQTIFEPQAGDVAEVVARYGPPVQIPEAPSEDEIVVRIRDGSVSIDGYRITRLSRRQ